MRKKAGMLLLVIGAVVLFLSGCISMGGTEKKAEWKPAESVSSPPYVHTVKYPGETMRIISMWYTGNAENWEAIADANPNINYENMVAGNKIFIPANLLKTTEPLTQEFMDSIAQKSKPRVEEEKKKPVSQPKPRPKNDEDFDLIGPK